MKKTCVVTIFTCCLNIGLINLTIFTWALICLHDVTQESVVAGMIILSVLLFVKMLSAAMMLSHWKVLSTIHHLYRDI